MAIRQSFSVSAPMLQPVRQSTVSGGGVVGMRPGWKWDCGSGTCKLVPESDEAIAQEQERLRNQAIAAAGGTPPPSSTGSGSSSSNTGTSSGNLGGLDGGIKEVIDTQFQQTKDLMGLTNEFRTKEGATQGQIDEQAYRRLNAELQTRKYMQDRAGQITNEQRDKDYARAVRSFKGNF